MGRVVGRRAAAGAAVALLLAVVGCTTEADPAPRVPEDAAPPTDPPLPGEYRPGRAAAVALPAGTPQAVAVLVPGGGWTSAHPGALEPLADHLTASGLAAVTITYGTAGTGDFFPGPADDVACAVAYAAQQVPDVPVVLVGHSAGAQLSALVGLVPARADDACPHPAEDADAVVGLAGPYDVTATLGVATRLFGVTLDEGPDVWEAGNPQVHAGSRPEVPFLLLHGTHDRVVPTFFTASFAEVLERSGHEVTVGWLPDVDHGAVARPDVVGDAVVAWVRSAVLGTGAPP